MGDAKILRVKALTLAAWLVVTLGASGCANESAPESSPPTPRDRLADELAATLCEGARPCCGELGYGEPTDSCRSSMRNAVMASIIAAEDQLRELVPEEHDACLAAFVAAIAEAPSCDYLPAPLELETRCPTIFTPIPEGTGGPGDACAGIFECASPAEAGTRDCVADSGSGRCVWYVDRAQGEACAPSGGTVPVCPEGLACVPAAEGDPVCGAIPSVGDACVLVEGGCAEGYVCEENATGDLKCAPEILAGESCFGRPGACAPGLFCNVASNCQPLPDPCASGDCPALILQNVCR